MSFVILLEKMLLRERKRSKLLYETQVQARQIASNPKYSFSIEDLKNVKEKLDAPHYKYLGWIARKWDELKDEKIDLLIKDYEGLKSRKADVKPDINQYKSVDELKQDLQTTHKNPTLASVDPSVGKSKLVYDKDKIRVYHVLDEEASIELGKGTSWCTSRDDDENLWPRYIDKNGGTKYIILNGNLSLSNVEHKIGVVVDTDGDFKEFRDVKNKRLNPNEYLNKWNIPKDIFKSVITLNSAIQTKDMDIINRAIKTGAKLTYDSLNSAIQTKDMDIINRVIGVGATPNIGTLYYAIKTKDIDIVNIAIDVGATPNRHTEYHAIQTKNKKIINRIKSYIDEVGITE